jgi:hypothetical protein
MEVVMLLIGITVAVALLVIIGADIYLASKGGFNATLSWWMYTTSVQYPILPAAFGFIVGLLMGHFFWDQALNVSMPCPTSQ